MSIILNPFQLLEIHVISAQDLEAVSRSMRTYAVAWVHPDRKLSTRVDTEGRANPTWNDKFVFRVDDRFLRADTTAIMVEIYALHWFRDVHVGTVRVLVSNLLPPPTRHHPYSNQQQPLPAMRFVALQVRRPSGRPQGILNIGVSLLDSSMRSMPLYSHLSASAVGFHELMGGDDDSHLHHGLIHLDHQNPQNNKTNITNNQSPITPAFSSQQIAQPPTRIPQLRRSRSERSDRVSDLDFNQPSGSVVNGSMVNGSVVSATSKGQKMVKASSLVGGIKHSPVASSVGASSVDDAGSDVIVVEDMGSRLGVSDVVVDSPTDGKGSNINGSEAAVDLNKQEDKAASAAPAAASHAAAAAAATNTDTKVVDSMVAGSEVGADPPPPAKKGKNGKEGSKVVEPTKTKSAKKSTKGKSGSVVDGSDVRPDRHRVIAGSIVNGSDLSGYSAKYKVITDKPIRIEQVESPLRRTKPTGGKVEFAAQKKPAYHHYGMYWTESEVGPSASEVAAAMAEGRHHPANMADDGRSSVLDKWSLDGSVEGLRSKLARWRTDLPPVYDAGEFESMPSSSAGNKGALVPVPVGSSGRRGGSSGRNNRTRRHSEGGGEPGLFSCVGSIFGYECSCVCGSSVPPPKKKAGSSRRNVSPSLISESYV